MDRNQILANRRGQSLVVAIAALFMLMFIAGIFIAMVSQGLTRAGRGSDVVGAQALAEAGVRYADSMLTNSAEGADWRPPQADRNNINGDDPDADYLNDGYSRFACGNGRFLIRLSYPGAGNAGDPLYRCIKIESIGRVGLIDSDDPTTFKNSQPIRLRRELMAFKPIGITDYAVFVTNKDRSTEPATLGIPDTTPGIPNDSSTFKYRSEYTGPIRVNGDLQWVGENIVHLDRRIPTEADYTPDAFPSDFRDTDRNGAAVKGDRVEVSGKILHWQDPSVTGSTSTVVKLEMPGMTDMAEVLPSDDPDFQSNPFAAPTENAEGIYRDGLAQRDKYGRARWTKRLEPPTIDARNPQTGMSRYITLTKLSGTPVRDDKAPGYGHNTGEFGLGEGIYIDNTGDIQANHGDLTAEWLNPGAANSPWSVDRYTPPGVNIIFYGSNSGAGLVEITRSGSWRTIDGTISNIFTRYYRFYVDGTTGKTRYVVLDGNNSLNPIADTDSPFNGVIYAEGNIRVHGRVPDGIPLTLVSGGTIYIEGNIIKGADAPIALLAKDYVCVNTTQFTNLDANHAESAFYTVSSRDGYYFRGNLSFGIDPGTYPNIGSSSAKAKLFISHRKDSDQPCNILMRTGTGLMPTSEYNFTLGTGVAYSNLDDLLWRRDSFDFVVSGSSWAVNSTPGLSTSFDIRTDYTTQANYQIERMAIQPLDIRIEALIYAQEKCFYVIPGRWFNPDASDTRANAAHREPNVAPDFPFYGEPLDVRIWINGAISMNHTASMADTAEWCRKWGWTPPSWGDGTSSVTSAHKWTGLTYVYDDELRHTKGSNQYTRTPLLPRLPVSPDLIFYGNSIN